MSVFGKEPSSDATGLRKIAMLVVPPLAAVLGLAAGGWVWGYLGKKLLGFTREDVELLVAPPLPVPALDRYKKNWYFNVLFGPTPAPSSTKAGTPHLAGLDGESDSATAAQAVLYECPANAVTADWNETTTTKRVDLAMAKADWWPCRRGVLQFRSDALTFADWTIRYAEIDDAVVTLVTGVLPSYYLRIRANGLPYQFCIMKVNPQFFRGELPFPVRRATATGFTWLNLASQMLCLVALLAFFILWLRSKR
jgi:hypothetical protein